MMRKSKFIKRVSAIFLVAFLAFPHTFFAYENDGIALEKTTESVISEEDISMDVPENPKVIKGITSQGDAVTDKAVYKDTIELNKSNFTLGVGDTYIITANIIGGSYTANDVSWNVSDENIADITKSDNEKLFVSNVIIKAKNTGSAQITASLPNGNKAEITLNVKNQPDAVQLTKSNLTLGIGETFVISESTNPGSYALNFTWSSSDENVAEVVKTVANRAQITAKSAGTADITITTYNGKTATCRLTVKPAPTSVKLSVSSKTLGAGEAFVISESTNSGSYAANFTWSSSNNKVATVTKTVSNKAQVVAKSVGTAKIIINTYNGQTAVCNITVKSAPSSVKLSSAKKTLGAGEEFIISESTNSGSYASNFTWSSSNKTVAVVEKKTANKAKITAVGTGTAKISIKTYNGKTAVCTVTVKSAPASVKLSKSSITLNKGETYIISESTNAGSYAADFTWGSSNINVAVVEKTTANKARITAVGTGTAKISIKTYNGKTAYCTVKVTNNTLISVPYISQQYNYPTGCESVSAVMLLQYYGFNITPNKFIDNYLTKKPISYSNGYMTTASPYSAFIGSPYSSNSYGCYAPVIADAMNKYLKNTSYKAKNTTGTSLESLVNNNIEKGQPVLIWATMNMVPTVKTSTWVVNYAASGDPYPVGSTYTWLGNEHCLVLVGQTADCYIMNDPYNSNGIVYYSKSLVNQRFNEQGKNSVVIEKR